MVDTAPKKKSKPVPVVPPKKKVIPPPPPVVATLTVEVVEVLTGKAIKDATVELQGVDIKPTGANGKVTFKPIPPKTVNILVRKDKHGPVPAAKGDPFTPGVNVILTGVVLVAGPRTITVQMCDGTGSLLVRARRIVNNALVALPKAEVEVVGQRLVPETPDDGEQFFNGIPAGKFSVRVRKVGYGPRRKTATDTFAFGEGAKDVTVPAGHPEQIDIEMENPGNTVTKIFAVIKDTVGLVAAPALAGEPAAAAGSQRLKSSNSNSLSLTANVPVVLVRGCNKVTLTVTTTPAGSAVAWQAKPNENKSTAPALAVSADGKTATLSTDKTGSFAIIAADGESRIVWNVVFAHLKVDVKSSVVKAQKAFYSHSSSGTGAARQIGVSSGKFVTSQAAWEATVDMQVIGGGADGSIGAPKIHIHYLQNGVADSAAGNYTGPPAAAGGAVVTGAMTETPPSLPILDANGSGGPGSTPPGPPLVPHIVDTPNAPPTIWFTTVAKLTSLGNRKFRLVSLDSPGVGFPARHSTKAAMIRSISGDNSFRAAVAATSEDAVNNLVVVAALRWRADFSGSVTYPAGSPAPPALVTLVPGPVTLTWTGTTNNAFADAQYALVSDATGGQDAALAGFRITGPRFNSAAGQVLVPT